MARRALTAARRLAAGVALLGGAGCGGAWHVVAQASPDPFAGQARFAVDSVDYTNVRVAGRSEDAYLAAEDEARRSSFADDKAGLDDRFVKELRAHARRRGIDIVRSDGEVEAAFVIQPTVSSLDPAGAASSVEMDVKIVAPDGKVLDEIRLSHGNAAPAGRLPADGEALGALVAQYLESRVGRVESAAPLPPETEEPAAEDPEATPPPKRHRTPEPSTPPEPAAAPAPPPSPPHKRKPGARRTRRPAPSAPKPLPLPAVAPGTPIAGSPGFVRLEDGTSRIWIEVSAKVPVIEMRGRGRSVFRLRGASVLQATNELSLPTGFFTTPVERVQLVTQGADVDLVVDLREDLVPVSRVVDTPRGMVLQIDLPRSAAFVRKDAAPEPGRPSAKRPATTTKLGDGPED